MNRSVVIHHSTAWCRSHRATSRCPAGRVWRWGFGRGGKRGAGAPLPRVMVPLPPLQPDQKAIGQHDGHGMPMKPRPQPPLVLVPAHLALGLFMTRLDRMPPMGHAGQRFEGRVRGQVAPEIFPLLGLPPRGSLPDQPALVVSSITGDAPTAYRDKLLAQPPFGPVPPATRAPLPPRHG